MLTDKEWQEFVKEDIEKARCFLNEIALMGLDLDRDILLLYNDSEKLYGRLWKEDRMLVLTLNRLCSNPLLRKEEIGNKKSLKILLRLGLAEELIFNGMKFYQASIPSYDSEIATLLKLHSEEAKPDYSLLVKIADNELTLKILEHLIKRPLTVPLLSRIPNVVRDKVRYVLEKLVRLGILKRYKGDRREVFYTFASESVRLKILKIFSALGLKFEYEPILTGKFFDELKKAGKKLFMALGSILRGYSELLPIKLKVILEGLKRANNKLKDKVMEFVIEKLK